MDEYAADRVTTVMANCSTQLRRAHDNLSSWSDAPSDSLAKISGVADALDALVARLSDLVVEAQQARRTAGGLMVQVSQLRRENNALSSRAIERL